jgi:hypothetical protein
MRDMIRTMFSSITSLFRAVDLSSRTVENYAKWTEAESAAFEAEAKIEREGRIEKLRAQLLALPGPESVQGSA